MWRMDSEHFILTLVGTNTMTQTRTNVTGKVAVSNSSRYISFIQRIVLEKFSGSPGWTSMWDIQIEDGVCAWMEHRCSGLPKYIEEKDY